MTDYPFHCDPRAVADSGDELSIQVRFINRMKMIAPKVRLVATPNGGKRTQWAAMQAKREGMAKGFADLTVLWSNGFAGAQPVPGMAFIEFKQRDGVLSDPQISWLNWMTLAGFHCGCFRSVDTAVAFLKNCGAPFLQEREAA